MGLRMLESDHWYHKFASALGFPKFVKVPYGKGLRTSESGHWLRDNFVLSRALGRAPVKKTCTSGLFWRPASNNMAPSIFGRTTLAIHRYSRFRHADDPSKNSISPACDEWVSTFYI